MREGRPSFTAAAVAAARAVTGVDPVAPRLVTGPLSWVVRAGLAGAGAATALNLGTLGLLDHVELRTRAIDAALREGLASGCAQLVLLGAGLDARAWRMRELSGTRVFEVDHPSTQGYKRARIAARIPAAEDVRFVAVDFARDSLEASLAGAGHDPDAPTFWIWEGVTPYLPREATRATLAAIGARSAPQSRLAVTYGQPRATTLGPGAARLGKVGFRIVGEHIVGLLSRREMHEELEAVGYRVLEDLSARDWGTRYGRGRPRILIIDEHLAVAVSDGSLRGPRAA